MSYNAGTTGTNITHAVTYTAHASDSDVTSLCGRTVTLDPMTSFRTSRRPCARCAARVIEIDRAVRGTLTEE